MGPPEINTSGGTIDTFNALGGNIDDVFYRTTPSGFIASKVWEMLL
jgi:hypothetical protein